MRKIGIVLLTVLALLASWAVAQSQPLKPVGAFSVSSQSPGWMSFGHVSSDAGEGELFAKAEMSRQTGRVWLLYLAQSLVLAPDFQDQVQTLDERLQRTGLRPYIVAVFVGEEWYEQRLGGAFGSVTVDQVRDFLGQRHRDVKALLNLPTVWLTTLVNNDPRHGDVFYRPVPPATDILAIDAYVPEGPSMFHPGPATFDQDVAPIFQHAVNTTTLPIVIIPQWFRTESGMWRDGPSRTDLEKYAQWHQHPRVIATMGFLWESRPGIVGLDRLGVDINWLGHLYGGVR